MPPHCLIPINTPRGAWFKVYPCDFIKNAHVSTLTGGLPLAVPGRVFHSGVDSKLKAKVMIRFTQAQIAAIERSLDKMEQDLHDDKSGSAGGQKYIDLAGAVHDRGDESVASEIVDVDSALNERHERELHAIKVARERLAAGRINQCDECGEEIGYLRLVVYPMAVRCIECQEHFDSTHAHEARPSL